MIGFKTNCIKYFYALQSIATLVTFLCLNSILLSSCASPTLAPVTDLSFRARELQASRPIPPNGIHKVHRGETLFSIAWRYGLDYKQLAKINNIDAPFQIFPNQSLVLETKPIKTPISTPNTTKNTQKNENIAHRYKNSTSNNKEVHKKDSHSRQKSVHIEWTWPVVGKVIEGFSAQGIGNKGLDFAGTYGDRVNAAADGNVVYSGSGLRGYGNLIIIKHNDVFLSAYAHNSRILIREGDWVKAGEKIAEIGSTDTDRNKLHFEIRRRGKPVNPLSYLPKR